MTTILARLLAVFFVLVIGGNVHADESRDISVIQLIANPELFNGQKVRVIGFLHLEFEGDAVYLHRDDFENSIDKNSVAIELDKLQIQTWRNLNNHYVMIEGSFSSVDKGHLGMRSGSLRKITRLSNWSVKRTKKPPPERSP